MKLLLCLLGCAFAADNSVNWGYRDVYPNELSIGMWHTIKGSECNGREQSPIDIETQGMNTQSVHWPDLDYQHYDKPGPRNWVLYNNGKTIGVNWDFDPEYQMFGAGLVNRYHPIGMHFHWGDDFLIGSEHTIDGVPHPLELHIVHTRSDYMGDAGAALGSEDVKRDDLAVLGIMITVGEHNPALQQLIDQFWQIKSANTSATMPAMALKEFFPVSTCGGLARYHGSLTTPMCQEKVIWTLKLDMVEASKEQLQMFHHAFLDGGYKSPDGSVVVAPRTMKPNFREVQALNGRQIQLINSDPACRPGASKPEEKEVWSYAVGSAPASVVSSLLLPLALALTKLGE